MIKKAGAAVAQLVECELPKLEVAGSNPVRRSKFRDDNPSCHLFFRKF